MDYLNKYGLNLSVLNELQMLGLIQFKPLSGCVRIFSFELYPKLHLIRGKSTATVLKYPDKKILIGTVLLSQAGLSIARFTDIFSRKVTGWTMDTRIRDSLVLSALNQAIGREHPEKGLIVQTDRGSQYTSQRFQALLNRYGFVQSMSRKGNPYDNAIMESFYRTLKRELVQDAHYENPEQARQDIFRYIELYYNTERIHSALGWLSPVQFESQNA